jgi:hypothetical protein
MNTYKIEKFFKGNIAIESYCYVIRVNNRRKVMVWFTKQHIKPVYKGSIYNIFEELNQNELMDYSKHLFEDLKERKWIKEECESIEFEWNIKGSEGK